MERELFLVKESNYDGTKLQMEIETIEKLLPYIESFSAFVANNDICDLCHHTFITNNDNIRNALEEGLDCTTKYYVFGKN